MFELHLFTIRISLKASFSLCLFGFFFLFILATLMLNINLSACHKIMVSTSFFFSPVVQVFFFHDAEEFFFNTVEFAKLGSDKNKSCSKYSSVFSSF